MSFQTMQSITMAELERLDIEFDDKISAVAMGNR